VGVGRLCRAHGKNEAEFAVIVADSWQGRGVGTQLLRSLVRVGRGENLQRITGVILSDNIEMRRVCERVGFTVSGPQDGECVARIEP
jgi:acetyltransferase